MARGLKRRMSLMFLFVAAAFCFATLFMSYTTHSRQYIVDVYGHQGADYDDDEHHDDDWHDPNMQGLKGDRGPVDMLIHGHSHAELEKTTVADEYFKKVRVLCWIMTSPTNLPTKATAVKATWAKRFNKYIFISSETNTSFPTVGLDVQEGRAHLTAKTMKAYNYSYEHHYDDAEWFMKADDDTYVIVENLRYFLSHYDPTEPIYFGYHFNMFSKQGYMSGGAGYVLSKAALKLLATVGLKDPTICKPDGGAEDAEMGTCLMKLGVKAGHSLDVEGRETFHPFDLKTHLQGGYPDWYFQYAYNKVEKGFQCCSDFSISFHYVRFADMYFLDFMLYHMRPFGIEFQMPKRMFERTYNLSAHQNWNRTSKKRIF